VLDLELLKEKIIALQEVIYFDKEQYYREQTKSPDVVQKLIAALEKNRRNSGEEAYFLLTALGYCYRVINQPKKAIKVFQKALATVTEDNKKRMITLIRLGEASKYDGQHQLALQTFEYAESILHKNNFFEFEDFLCQHQAKCYFELNDLEKAEELLLMAYSLRKEKEDESLIKSTQQVLKEVRKRRKNE
jgi:HTH-type transcriptional regulator, pleiotropic regulator of extracellular virulence genes